MARPWFLLLMGAVVLVLAISCANVSGLLLARGAGRQREVALRLALGARSSRVLQQALIEGLVLALAGTAAGLLVAFVGIRALVDLAPALPLIKEASLDGRVLIFTVATALATGIVFGIGPTLQALRVQANDVLKEGGTRQAGGARISAIRTALTIGEVALALILLIGGTLFVRSFANVRNVEPGFDPAGVVTAFLAAPPADANDASRTVEFFERVIARLEDVPGVSAVAAASAVPLVSNETSPFRVEGEAATGKDVVFAEQPKVTAAYFRAMGITLLRGRTFNESDAASAEPVAVVSKRLADRYWPAADAPSQRVAITDGKWRRVVGVVDDVRNDGLESQAKPTIVWLVARRGLVLGTAGVALGLAGSIALSRAVEGPLFGVSALDPLTYLLASTLLLAVVGAASSLPAWRATRVAAIAALRSE